MFRPVFIIFWNWLGRNLWTCQSMAAKSLMTRYYWKQKQRRQLQITQPHFRPRLIIVIFHIQKRVLWLYLPRVVGSMSDKPCQAVTISGFFSRSAKFFHTLIAPSSWRQDKKTKKKEKKKHTKQYKKKWLWEYRVNNLILVQNILF